MSFSEWQNNLVALLAPVSTMTPGVAKGFPARAQIVEESFHLKMLQIRAHHWRGLR
jgi:hypothetical protein